MYHDLETLNFGIKQILKTFILNSYIGREKAIKYHVFDEK